MNAITLTRPFVNVFTASFPDLWAALQQADRDTADLMTRLDASPIASAAYGTILANLQEARARQERLLGEIKSRLEATTGGIDIHQICGRL